MYGWNPTRENNAHHFAPLGYDGKDCNTWDWGGNLIVHELWQDEDGDLFVKQFLLFWKQFQKKKSFL